MSAIFGRGSSVFDKIRIVLFVLSFICLTRVDCVSFFGAANPSKEISASEDVTECSWCVKQLVKEIVNKAKHVMKEGEEEVEMKVRLRKKDLEMLDEFGNSEDSWVRLEEVLRVITPSAQPVDYEPIEFQQGLSPSVIIMMSTGGVTLCAMWMILSRQSICLVTVLLLLLSFSVGIAWNWWKIYNEEYSKRVTQLPDECKPDETSWYHSVKGFLVDPNCGDYFKAPVDDPVAMVSPHQVITETISMIFISPVSLAASSFATFIHSLTDNLIWPLNWIIQIVLTVFLLAAGTVVAITILAGLFNLDMKFSTCLVSGELKPSKQRPTNLRLSSTNTPAIKGKKARPTNLSLFPAPPSPFR